MRKIITIGAVISLTCLMTACNRTQSVKDIPTVEEIGSVDQNLLNELRSEQVQGNLEQIEGNDFTLESYVDDSHFYEESATVYSWGETKRIPIKTTVKSIYATDNMDELEGFDSEIDDIQKNINHALRNGYTKEEFRYLVLDVVVENLGDETMEYTGNFHLFERVDDDTYAEAGYCNKKIEDIVPGLVERYADGVNFNSSAISLLPGEERNITILYILKEEQLGSKLCVGLGETLLSEYDEETKRYEPTTDENAKLLYIN